MSTRYADSGRDRLMGVRPDVLGWLVAGGAVAMRLLYLLETTDDPTTFDPIVDARTYHDLAAGLARDGTLDAVHRDAAAAEHSVQDGPGDRDQEEHRRSVVQKQGGAIQSQLPKTQQDHN